MSRETFNFDPMHTTILWQCNHFGFSNPKGLFSMVEGVLNLDETNPERSDLNVIIDIATLSTGIEMFNEHLWSKDFFNLESYPTATFVSQKIATTGVNQYKVTGLLTLIGVQRQVVIDALINKIGEHPMSKRKTIGISANLVINRADYGMTAYIPMVGENVQLNIEAEAQS